MFKTVKKMSVSLVIQKARPTGDDMNQNDLIR